MNKRHLYFAGSIVAVLSVPYVGMFFTNEVNWSFTDFLVAGTLLILTFMLIELVFRKVQLTALKVISTMAILFFALLVWVELAVGVFGTPIAGS